MIKLVCLTYPLIFRYIITGTPNTGKWLTLRYYYYYYWYVTLTIFLACTSKFVFFKNVYRSYLLYSSRRGDVFFSRRGYKTWQKASSLATLGTHGTLLRSGGEKQL